MPKPSDELELSRSMAAESVFYNIDTGLPTKQIPMKPEQQIQKPTLSLNQVGEIDLKKLGSSLDGQTLAQLKEIDHLNAESHKSLIDMRNKGMAMMNLNTQIGVIPNETKYNKAWQKIVSDTGP